MLSDALFKATNLKLFNGFSSLENIAMYIHLIVNYTTLVLEEINLCLCSVGQY